MACPSCGYYVSEASENGETRLWMGIICVAGDEKHSQNLARSPIESLPCLRFNTRPRRYKSHAYFSLNINTCTDNTIPVLHPPFGLSYIGLKTTHTLCSIMLAFVVLGMSLFPSILSDLFLTFAPSIHCRCSRKPPRSGGSNEYTQPLLWSQNKEKNVYSGKTHFYLYILGVFQCVHYTYVLT